jgi:hypothetical protein
MRNDVTGTKIRDKMKIMVAGCWMLDAGYGTGDSYMNIFSLRFRRNMPKITLNIEH